MPHSDDPILLSNWRSGDQESFAVLVARHHGLVRAACARQVGSGEVDDCVQAVFLVLSRRPEAAGRVPSLGAWLLRVASFVCRHSRRAAERRRRAESAAAQTARQATAETVPAEALGHLDECLQRLPERQRAAVAMHYLAGRSPEEVAAALGVSRDNVYQLLSRGLAGLRTLFARRGVVLGSAALASLLAGEAQAAAAAAAPPTIIAALGAPSAAVTALAHGAMTAMTIASIAPFACAAGLILAAATTTIALTAEPAPVPVPATPAPVVKPASPAVVLAKVPAAPVAWDAFPANPNWEQLITVDFQDTHPDDIQAFLERITTLRVESDPTLTQAITLRCERMRFADVVTWLAIISDARVTVRDGKVRLEAAGPRPAEPPVTGDENELKAIHEMLSHQRLTVDLKDTPGTDVIAFLRQVTGCNYVVHPRCHLDVQRVTLKATEQMFETVLIRIVQQMTDSRMVVRNGAIGILPKDMAPAVGSAPVAPVANF